MKGFLWWLLLTFLPRRWFYSNYLRSKTWRARRKRILARDGGRCQACRISKHLHVHHKSYKFVGMEPGDHLVTLCKECHQAVHRGMKYLVSQ